jgi:hypothetical protein
MLTSSSKPRIGSTINFLLGGWLTLSAFLWPHWPGERVNTALSGVVILVIALGALVRPAMRWVNALPAVWLFGTSLAMRHHEPLSQWNEVAIALVVFLASIAEIAAAPIATTPRGTPTH